eukprot:g21835.t1
MLCRVGLRSGHCPASFCRHLVPFPRIRSCHGVSLAAASKGVQLLRRGGKCATGQFSGPRVRSVQPACETALLSVALSSISAKLSLLFGHQRYHTAHYFGRRCLEGAAACVEAKPLGDSVLLPGSAHHHATNVVYFAVSAESGAAGKSSRRPVSRVRSKLPRELHSLLQKAHR